MEFIVRTSANRCRQGNLIATGDFFWQPLNDGESYSSCCCCRHECQFSSEQTDVGAHAHTRARARTHTHTRTNAHTHTRTHARTHARTHTHTSTQPSSINLLYISDTSLLHCWNIILHIMPLYHIISSYHIRLRLVGFLAFCLLVMFRFRLCSALFFLGVLRILTWLVFVCYLVPYIFCF